MRRSVQVELLLRRFVQDASSEWTELGQFCVGCNVRLDEPNLEVRPITLIAAVHKPACFVEEARKLVMVAAPPPVRHTGGRKRLTTRQQILRKCDILEKLLDMNQTIPPNAKYPVPNPIADMTREVISTIRKELDNATAEAIDLSR